MGESFTPGKSDGAMLPVQASSLRAAAQALAREWSVVHRAQGRSGLGKRVDAAAASFDRLYARLGKDPQSAGNADLLVEVRENPRMLRSVLVEMRSLIKQLDRLPRVVQGNAGRTDSEEPRLAAVAGAFLNACGGVWSSEAFTIFVEEVQRDEPLNLMELWPLASLLKFVLLEELLEQAHGIAAATSAESDIVNGDGRDHSTASIAVRFKSLREIGHTDWVGMVEPLIVFDKVLQQDPAQAYTRMDFESRQRYRRQVARLAGHSECTELKVAEAALELAAAARGVKAAGAGDLQRLLQRRTHIGYHLIDKGAAELRARIGYHPRLIDRLRISIRNHDDYFYIGGAEVLTVLLIGVMLAPLMANYSPFGGLTLAFLLLLLPATQGAIDLIVNTVTALFHAEALPKLDFSGGIPEEFTTLVAVPALLINEKQVRELVEGIEVRFLANQDRNLHFALLTDLPDSVTKPHKDDADPLVELAIELIDALNHKYSEGKYGQGSHGAILLLHRHRIFNARQEVWMGWERKRGKLLDLNKFLRGEFNAFPVTAGEVGVLGAVRYIITLDSDTQLPRGTANQLVGAMAHPLNRAIIDPALKVVTEGYGILQPRVGVSVQSAARSRLAAIYSGQTGFDIYTRAVSDAYQDLFGEGIFTGKGIYEVNTFHAVLDRRFPRNSLLSHDLIEGSYARAGLATDIEVIDDYPSHYSAFTRRKHRWVRGDWQIAQWLFARVPDESGAWVRNPISTISRWKILDNLRRSLVEPFTFLLLLAGWLGLPGGALYWTVVTLVLLLLPGLVQFGFGMGGALVDPQPGAAGEAVHGLMQALGITFLTVVFLAHQTLLSIDAIGRAMVRRFVTGRRLLEWETAAEAETNTSRRTTVDRYLAAMPVVAVVLAVTVFVFNRRAILVALPILALWGLATAITLWLNRAPAAQEDRLNDSDEQFLRQLALRIWRFYADFGGASHNFLIPDNVEEDGLHEAARVSPTNVGMLLNARQAACEFGFITTAEFGELTTRTLATMERLPKVRGHLYNWYNTETLEALLPITISSVDSGNLAASLYTLSMGARSLLQQPLVRAEIFAGLQAHLELSLLPNEEAVKRRLPANLKTPGTAPIALSAGNIEELVAWLETLPQAASSTVEITGKDRSKSGEASASDEAQHRVEAVRGFITGYAPWLLPQFAALAQITETSPGKDGPLLLKDAADFAEEMDRRLGRAWATTESSQSVLAEQLRSLLPEVRQRLRELTAALTKIADDAERLAEEMDFGFLLQKGRGLLSIGYEVESEKLLEACYDMLASEARIATFIAVAKGDIPQQCWFKLGRTHTLAFGRPVLLSWTGTMFEYLMPSLWMRSFPDTLISRTQAAAVAIQRDFARRLKLPWGISESGHAPPDAEGHYPYQAFGIPLVALKWDASAGPVVSPYSSFLALGVDSCEALKNLRRMDALGWVGAYGFYEAADFTAGGERPVLVREWMAHHQGMSFLAILNLLKNNVVQEWFHATPQLQATELLLHEKPIREAVLRAEYKQFAATPARAARSDAAA